MDDHFTFAATRTYELEDTDEFSAVRFHVTAQLAGSTFEQFLVDISQSSTATIQAEALRHALQYTFAERARQPLPTTLPPPPNAWTDPYKRLALTVRTDSDLHAAYTRAAAFLNPILTGRTHDSQWDPEHRKWS